eukprot:GHVR01011843.1.p1 GENE.GHVR01011843.1~~GHVR01011843.1.p1  ORF type:complete len:352 (-),score=75.11 GHVR01011843.1:391-1446(-)
MIVDTPLEGADLISLEKTLRDRITWCKDEKRAFLRMRAETRLAGLLFKQRKFDDALILLSQISNEVKKLDDKLLLVDIHLIEAKTYFATHNILKAKSCLTASRTNANAIHCPPLLQAEIDMLNGCLNAHDSDFKTAFSYFYEAFEAYNLHTQDPSEKSSAPHACEPIERPHGRLAALQSLKYMLLMKIMLNQPDDVTQITSGKQGLKYAGPVVSALRDVARSLKQRNLKLFELALSTHRNVLEDDCIVHHHLKTLHETLTEENIRRILEPYSKVDIAHVAASTGLSVFETQSKLSAMILDKKISGTLDQGVGVLVLLNDSELPSTYADALGTIKNMTDVVDSLYELAAQLN